MTSFALDLRTLSVVLMLITVFLSVLMIYIWRVHKTYPGFKLWMISNFTVAAGFLFLSLRGAIPDFFTIVLGNSIVFAGLLLAFEGNRKFLGLGNTRFFNAAMLAALVALMTLFTHVENNVIYRISVVSLFYVIVTARIFYIFNYYYRKEKNSTYRFTAATYLVFALIMAARAALNFLFSHITNFYAPDFVQTFSYLSFIVFTIIWTFNYLTLNNQRLQNDLISTQQKLEKLAATDFLTGVNNSRRFFEISETEISRAHRFNHSLSVIMFDLDFFKNVNDSYGHAGGDAVLTKVANICKITLRNIDVVGRLGGEEFAVLMPHTKISGAKNVAEFLRSVIENAEIEFSGKTIKITASFGVSELADTDTKIKEMLDRADAALYEAKRGGRNRVVADYDKSFQKLPAAA